MALSEQTNPKKRERIKKLRALFISFIELSQGVEAFIVGFLHMILFKLVENVESLNAQNKDWYQEK